MKHEVVLESEQTLLDLGAALARASTGPLIIYLKGELGAGKTTFARGFLHGAGHQGVVKSPTYTLVEPYRLDTAIHCYHFDLYRLSDPEELEFTGARDYFDSASTCLIEWPENAAGHLPPADLVCTLEHHEKGRKLTLDAVSDKAKSIVTGAFLDFTIE